MERKEFNFAKTIFISSFGVFLAELITAPICTFKTVFQTEGLTFSKSFQFIYSKHGVLGFFRSYPLASFNQIISQSSKYTIYFYLQNYRSQHQSDKEINIKSKICDGIISSAIVTSFSHPMDVIKTIIQRNESIFGEFKKYGIKRFYFGLDKSWMKMVVGGCCFMPIYDYSLQYFQNPFYASILTALVSSSIVHPFDYMKTLKMANKSIPFNISLFYKGISLQYSRIIPHFVITMCATEYLKNKI